MGHIVMFVKSVYVVYICTFYWMLFGLCIGIWGMFFFLLKEEHVDETTIFT